LAALAFRVLAANVLAFFPALLAARPFPRCRPRDHARAQLLRAE
jgi:hypothetical protein